MRWRKAAAASGAALGAAALYNVTASHRIAALDNLLGGESREMDWRGHRVAYTRHGAGTPVLLLHGIHAGASSYEWRSTIDALALIGPAGVGQLREAASTGQAATQLLLDAPIVGTAFYNALTSPVSMREFLEERYANDRLVTDELVEEYVQNARQPGAKHAVAAFVGGRLNVDIRNALRRVRHPLLILWGDQARTNSVQNAHAFRVLKPDAEWALVSDAGDLPHDEQPEQTNEAILRFLDRFKKSASRGVTPTSTGS
jgi:pimeloyl-ACP methyl ester carboxylesterase